MRARSAGLSSTKTRLSMPMLSWLRDRSRGWPPCRSSSPRRPRCRSASGPSPGARGRPPRRVSGSFFEQTARMTPRVASAASRSAGGRGVPHRERCLPRARFLRVRRHRPHRPTGCCRDRGRGTSGRGRVGPRRLRATRSPYIGGRLGCDLELRLQPALDVEPGIEPIPLAGSGDIEQQEPNPLRRRPTARR